MFSAKTVFFVIVQKRQSAPFSTYMFLQNLPLCIHISLMSQGLCVFKNIENDLLAAEHEVVLTENTILWYVQNLSLPVSGLKLLRGLLVFVHAHI